MRRSYEACFAQVVLSALLYKLLKQEDTVLTSFALKVLRTDQNKLTNYVDTGINLGAFHVQEDIHSNKLCIVSSSYIYAISFN